MRWLMIALLVSLGALLFVAACVARHIWQRARMRHNPPGSAGPVLDPAEESELEHER